MKTHTKRLALTAMLLGIIFTVFTATTVMASTNGVTSGDQQRDRDCVQDCGSCNQNDGACPNTCAGAKTQQQHQYGSTCAAGCTGDAVMQHARYRYQYHHCKNQGS